MRKLVESERGRLLEYVMKEPEINLFFIGDIENYGIDSDEVEVYVEEVGIYVPGVGKLWDSLILRYFDNYIIYSKTDTFQLEPVIDFLKDRIIDSMNGKASILRRIAPFFPRMRLDIQYMMRLKLEKNFRSVHSHPDTDKENLRLLTRDDAEKIVDLYASTEETVLRFAETRNKKISERKANLERDGFGMGMFLKGRLVCVAEISADSVKSGMIIGVVTHRDFRGRGYATRTTLALCEEALDRGKEFLCAFCQNPDAKKIYQKIGFEEMDQYSLMY